ncbi:retrovirus-related pol polyprotein from transposon TNT 1-94 [Tanacetum coccineum]
MEADGKDRPPMLAPSNYVQWKSRIKRYIDTKPNHKLTHYCLTHVPYQYQYRASSVTTATNGIDGTPEIETYATVPEEIKKQIDVEVKVVLIILTGIDNDIYFTVDACLNAMEMWKAIERLKQGESINVQDLETNLYWEFEKFTLRDGESLDSYYSRFYKMMNELREELKTVSYHKLYYIRKHQNEVNEIRAERLARNANPLALVAATQQPVYHLQPKPTHYNQSSSTRSQAATRNKGKEISNTPSPRYDSEPEAVSNEEATPRDKKIKKLMALISISDRRNGYDRQTGQYENQREVNVVGTKENVGTQVVQQTRIQCFNCKEFGHVARECKKSKRVRDSAYHKEKMLLYDEAEDQELEAYYMYMAKIQEVILEDADNSGPIFDIEPLAKKERDLLASLIKQMKNEIDESEKINKSLESSNKVVREGNTFLNSELTRYKDSDFVKTTELKCAKAYGLLAEQKYLKKAQSGNPRLYDIGYYNDNLALMLAPKTNDTIRLDQESRSKLISPNMKIVIEQKLKPTADRLTNDVVEFYQNLKDEMVVDLRYFKSLENEVKSLQSQLELQKT